MYRVDFTSQLGSGSGTVFLENGVLRGGDATIAYFGTYFFKDDRLIAEIKTLQHGPGFSILGNGTELAIEAVVNGNGAQGLGRVPGTQIEARFSLRKIAELP